MHSHVTEILPETGFHEGPGRAFQRLAWRPQNFMHARRDVMFIKVGAIFTRLKQLTYCPISSSTLQVKDIPIGAGRGEPTGLLLRTPFSLLGMLVL
jgi:hypothetical protein